MIRRLLWAFLVCAAVGRVASAQDLISVGGVITTRVDGLPVPGAVVSIVWGWGIAQHPYLLPQVLTVHDAAAPSATLTALLIVFGVAIVLVLPSIALLFTLAQRNLVGEEAAPGRVDESPV